jgi:methylmalonyl-CoA mutase C-terminal domain/subunit
MSSGRSSVCTEIRACTKGTEAFKRKGRIIQRKRKIRILVAKPGLDGHDRGARIIARAYRDAGFEVVYSGLHQTPEEIVQAAIQEDVDMVGLSSLAGAHMYLLPRVVELLKDKGAGDIVVCGGGIFPEEDIPKLKKAGIREIFTPGTPLSEAVRWVEEHVEPRD